MQKHPVSRLIIIILILLVLIGIILVRSAYMMDMIDRQMPFIGNLSIYPFISSYTVHK